MGIRGGCSNDKPRLIREASHREQLRATATENTTTIHTRQSGEPEAVWYQFIRFAPNQRWLGFPLNPQLSAKHVPPRITASASPFPRKQNSEMMRVSSSYAQTQCNPELPHFSICIRHLPSDCRRTVDQARPRDCSWEPAGDAASLKNSS